MMATSLLVLAHAACAESRYFWFGGDYCSGLAGGHHFGLAGCVGW
jgi:hypothetical protein